MRIPGVGSIWQAVRKVAVVEEKINVLTQAIESEHAERQQLHDRLDAKIEREIEREQNDRQRAEDATTNRIERLDERMSSVEDRLTRLEMSREIHEREMNATFNNFRGEDMLRMAQLRTAQDSTPALTEPDEENDT